MRQWRQLGVYVSPYTFSKCGLFWCFRGSNDEESQSEPMSPMVNQNWNAATPLKNTPAVSNSQQTPLCFIVTKFVFILKMPEIKIVQFANSMNPNKSQKWLIKSSLNDGWLYLDLHCWLLKF